jgi:hypothetical protein
LQAKETKIVLNNNLTDEQIERGERKKWKEKNNKKKPRAKRKKNEKNCSFYVTSH